MTLGDLALSILSLLCLIHILLEIYLWINLSKNMIHIGEGPIDELIRYVLFFIDCGVIITYLGFYVNWDYKIF